MRVKRIKAIAAVVLALGLAVPGLTVSAYAASRKKITTVSLEVKADIHVGHQVEAGSVELETKSSKYSIDDYQFENDSFAWEETDTPKLKVTLKADDNYYFAMTSASSVKLSGAGAKYVSASKQDSSATLVVTMTLSPLKEQVGEITAAQWGKLGQASWNEATGAGSYEVRVLKNGNPFGSVQKFNSSYCDLSRMLVRAGTYAFQVRGVNKYNSQNKGSWKVSETISVDEELAAKYRMNGGAAWLQDENGWWYRNGDGSYTVNDWQNINGRWYFFNEQGYMVTGWINRDNQWYFLNPDGDMAVNTVTPDGFVVDENGVYQTERAEASASNAGQAPEESTAGSEGRETSDYESGPGVKKPEGREASPAQAAEEGR